MDQEKFIAKLTNLMKQNGVVDKETPISPDSRKCLTPKCPNDNCHCRGLCKNCYQAANLAVKYGKTSWNALVFWILKIFQKTALLRLLANFENYSRR
jgi:hypothetical protein